MAAVSRNGVDVVTNDVSGRQTPSAVYFAGDHRLVGEHTTGHAGGNPRNLVHHIKSLLEEGVRGVPGDDDDDDRPASGGRSSGRDERDASDAQEQGQHQHQQPPHGQQAQRRKPEQHQKPVVNEQERPRKNDVAGAVDNDGNKSAFFCETRLSEDDAGRSGLLAVVQHMGEELELSPSDVIAYLLRHCAEVVARETGGAAGVEAAAAAAAAERGAAAVALSAQSCVVASVPSYFSLRQKRAVLDAAHIVGVPMPMVRTPPPPIPDRVQQYYSNSAVAVDSYTCSSLHDE